MKRTLIALSLLAVLACVATLAPPSSPLGRRSIVLIAQTLPVTKTIAWDDATAAADGVTNYTVTLDGTVVGSPTGLTQAVTFTTAGVHTVTVTATNIWGTSGPATLSITVKVPGNPANVRLQ